MAAGFLALLFFRRSGLPDKYGHTYGHPAIGLWFIAALDTRTLPWRRHLPVPHYTCSIRDRETLLHLILQIFEARIANHGCTRHPGHFRRFFL